MGKKIIVCDYCGKEISYTRHIKRHYNSCKEYTHAKYIEEKNNIIKELKNELEEYKNSEKEYFEIFKQFTKKLGTPDNTINNTINNTTNNTTINNVNMFFIMRSYTDALNYSDLMKAPLTDAETQCMIDHGGEEGCYNLIVTRCIDGIALEKRPIHCVDGARQKFLLRNDDTWEIDSKGEKIINTIYPKIVKACAPKPIKDETELKKFNEQHHRMNRFASGGDKRVIKRLAKKTLLKNNVKELDDDM